MKKNEDRRNDPKIREAVAAVLEARAEALLKAEKLIQEALTLLTAVPHFDVDDALYTRCVSAVHLSAIQISGDKPYILGHTETYIGNIASSELGRILAETNSAE
jgi:hypothetical protein